MKNGSPVRSAKAEPEPGREPAGVREDPLLDRALSGRLRQRRELFVRDEPSRKRRLAAIALAHPVGNPEPLMMVVHGRRSYARSGIVATDHRLRRYSWRGSNRSGSTRSTKTSDTC